MQVDMTVIKGAPSRGPRGPIGPLDLNPGVLLGVLISKWLGENQVVIVIQKTFGGDFNDF